MWLKKSQDKEGTGAPEKGDPEMNRMLEAMVGATDENQLQSLVHDFTKYTARTAFGVAQTCPRGRMPIASVQADRHGPSMMTGSPLARAASNRST